MSYLNQVVSPEPSTSQKSKQKAPAQPVSDVAGKNTTEQPESNERPSESRHLSPNIPPFKPFFTLIEDTNSSDHHNPTVHYIFSDDDTDLITEAALRALEPEGAAPLPPGSYDDDGGDDQDDRPHRREPKHSSLPPLTPGVQEHYIVLDMQPSPAAAPAPARSQSESTQAPTDTEATGSNTTAGGTTTTTTTPQTFTVTSSHSLTPTWQVLNTELSPAPTFETSPNPGSDTYDPSQGGLMLKVKGTAGFQPGPTRGRNNNQPRDQNLEEMMEQFEKRMDELRKVIEAGDVGSGVEGGQGEGREEGGEKVEEGEKEEGEGDKGEDKEGEGEG